MRVRVCACIRDSYVPAGFMHPCSSRGFVCWGDQSRQHVQITRSRVLVHIWLCTYTTIQDLSRCLWSELTPPCGQRERCRTFANPSALEQDRAQRNHCPRRDSWGFPWLPYCATPVRPSPGHRCVSRATCSNAFRQLPSVLKLLSLLCPARYE